MLVLMLMIMLMALTIMMIIVVAVMIMTTIIMIKIRRRRVTVATTGSTEPLSAFSIGRRGNQTRRMVMKLSCISYYILTPGTYNIIDDHHNDNDNDGEEEELSMVRLTIPMMPQFQFCCNLIYPLIFRDGELRRHGLLPRLGLERLEL